MNILNSQDTAELFFEDVRVPQSALLGRENGGFYQLMEQLPQERLIIAVHSAAHCEAMFEETRDWVKQRKAFGRRVADLQTVQHKLAELKTSIVVCRAFIDQCMELHNTGRLCGEMARSVVSLSRPSCCLVNIQNYSLNITTHRHHVITSIVTDNSVRPTLSVPAHRFRGL